MKIFKPVIHSIEINEYIDTEIAVSPYEFIWAEHKLTQLGLDFEEHNLMEIQATPEHLICWLVLLRRGLKKD